MNTASNRLQVMLSDGKAISIQVMHLENPVGSKENPRLKTIVFFPKKEVHHRSYFESLLTGP